MDDLLRGEDADDDEFELRDIAFAGKPRESDTEDEKDKNEEDRIAKEASETVYHPTLDSIDDADLNPELDKNQFLDSTDLPTSIAGKKGNYTTA